MADNQLLPILTESDIARYCTERSFQRGEDYHERGAIINLIRRRYIADLCAQYPRHRALQDELNRAGL